MRQAAINQRFINAQLVTLRSLFPTCLEPENRLDTDELRGAKQAVYGLLEVAEAIKQEAQNETVVFGSSDSVATDLRHTLQTSEL